MKLYGERTHKVAERIVDAFRQPKKLPQALAPIFVRRNDEVPCRKWSWHNQLVAAMSGTTDARGLKQWNKVGRHVVKGSQAIWILAPCTKRLLEKDDNGQESERTIVFGFRAIPVFAVEDTRGEDLELDTSHSDWISRLPLIDVAETWGINVDAYSGRTNAPLGLYRYAEGTHGSILLGVENLSTWAHEMVHAADHRLTNLAGRRFHKEIVAELGGAILLECLGMTRDADLGGAFEYIQSYAEQEKVPTVKACIQVLDRTCNAVQLILDQAQRLSLANATT